MNNFHGFLTPAGTSPVSAREMREIEDWNAEVGITRLLMMENAGAEIARFVVDVLISKLDRPKSDSEKIKVLLVAGTGNNGGDVFVAFRHLMSWKERLDIKLILLGKATDIKAEEALHNWKIISSITKGCVDEVSTTEEVHSLRREVGLSHILIVGIFGTGFKGVPRDLQRQAIEVLNSDQSAIVVSVDVPSGLESDTGKFELAVQSDYTITMARPKIGMVSTPEAKRICGEIIVANIGILE